MIRMTFEGGDEIAAALATRSARVSRKIQIEALSEAGAPMQKHVRRIAPRAPGAPDVADNINMAPVRKRADAPGDISVGIGVPRKFYYDWFLEFGTVDMRAQPMWRPSFDGNVQAALKTVRDAFWRELAARGIGRSVTTPSRPTGPGRLT